MKHTYKSKFFGFLLFCVLCVGTHTQLKAQFINIPDANFRAKLQILYPACFGGVGNIQLNTTCSAVTLERSLYVNNSNIIDLTGIGAFTFLEELRCQGNQLSTLPTLPATLTRLDCSMNLLQSLPLLPINLQILNCGANTFTSPILPALPASLEELACYNNQLTTLPTLPTGLRYLECSDNLLTSLPSVLPTNLISLSCTRNPFTSPLPVLPATLISLECVGNQLTALPILPAGLTLLKCTGNLLTSLPTLPVSLIQLECEENQLANLPPSLSTTSLQIIRCASNLFTNSLPALPTTLVFLNCIQNQLISLPVLPASLQDLYCNSNLLTSLPTLPASLRRLHCQSNRLTSLPSLPTGLQDLYCYNNLLDFADLEAISTRPANYGASPQYYDILPATVGVAIGGTLTINGTVGGTLNMYKWYRNNVLITGATSATFTKAGFVTADIGTYTCEVTSTFVGAGTTTGVNIRSSNVTVSLCSNITFTNTTVTNATVGTNYSLDASTTTPSSYLVSPPLPAGLSISTTGIIGGMPSVPTASAIYTVTATQGICTSTQTYTFAVVGITPVSLPPTNPTLSYNPATGKISFEWTNSAGVTGYVIEKGKYNEATNTIESDPNSRVQVTVPSTPTAIFTQTPDPASLDKTVFYRVKAIYSNGESAFTSWIGILVSNLAITALDNLSERVKVAPNPSLGVFSIDLGGINVTKSSLRIYDMQGKTVYTSDISTNQTTISLKDAPAGIYLIEINTTKGRILKKLAKQ